MKENIGVSERACIFNTGSMFMRPIVDALIRGALWREHMTTG